MVSATHKAIGSLGAVGVLALLLVLTFGAGVALADEQDDTITSDTYDVEETFEVQVDELGNCRYKDVLVYDREFFDAHAASFEEYPFLLSRRYRTMEDVNEIHDFQTGMNKESASVTLSFKETGRAYNMEDHWIMYGFYTKPVQISGSDVTIEETSTVNSDYTLWQDLDFKTTTHVSLPAGADNVRWDEGEYAIVWEMPQQAAVLAAPQGNVLQRNEAVFIPLFAILIAGALAVEAVILLRFRRDRAAAAATGPDTPAPAAGAGTTSTAAGTGAATTSAGAGAATTTTPPASGRPQQPPADAARATATSEHGPSAAAIAEKATDAGDESRPKYCRHCGAHLREDADEKYCTHCGKEIG